MSDLKIHNYPSPNFNNRITGCKIDKLVIHYTHATGEMALRKLCEPELFNPPRKVSAHYFINAEGEIYSLVPEEKNAWHAGIAYWENTEKINSTSIGIELENSGETPFSDKQMDALIALSKDILSRHNIPSYNVIGHSDVAPERKEDPGIFFDWKKLADHGIGLWPESNEELKQKVWDGNILSLQEKLNDYGYNISESGEMDEGTEKAILAWQRHFRPQGCNGLWDNECETKLESLLQQKHTVKKESFARRFKSENRGFVRG